MLRKSHNAPRGLKGVTFPVRFPSVQDAGDTDWRVEHVINGKKRCGYARNTCADLVSNYDGYCRQE
jgi:hypothetical protein